jgi:hypothetical protein
VNFWANPGGLQHLEPVFVVLTLLINSNSHKLDSPVLSAFSRMLARNTALQHGAEGN